ncbi:MAG: LysR family transcriptional regulator [Bauldia sp.]|nr:LysR family transcriptional regulator [Bauldia sp.]MCB1496891.1 LysR family transcriptional regulator [Bauldia sp.]
MFVAVVETGTFAAAAERLGRSSGQASKLVSRLEAELGVRLLNRTTRAVSATEAGRAYFERIRPLLDEFESLDLSIRDSAQQPRGRLRLTAPQSFGTGELVPALNVFATRYPEIELDVGFTDRVVNLVDEGFDMAVRIGRLADTSLVARRLCDVRIMLVASCDYLDAHGEPEMPEDVTRHACVIDTNIREPNRWVFGNGKGGTVVVPVNGRVRYSDPSACLRAAEAGLGLAHLPAFVAGAALEAGRVRRILPAFEPEPLGLHAVYPHSRHLAAKVRALVDFLVERYQGRPPWEKA